MIQIENDISIVGMNSDYAGLTWKFRVNPDSCDNPTHYENYIRLIAVEDQKIGMGVTHLAIKRDIKSGETLAILGFITLKAATLIKSRDDRIQYGEPALEIAELAVAHDCEGSGIGTLLTQYALHLARELRTNTLGLKYITLCADPCAVGFYKRFGFAGIDECHEVPRELWNRNCIPMFLNISQAS